MNITLDNFSLLSNTTDPDFRVRALADYSESRANSFADVINFIDDCIDCETEAAVHAAFQEYSFSDESCQIVVCGKILALITLGLNVYRAFDAEYVEPDPVIDLGDGDSEVFSTICTDLQDQLYAVQVLSAACRAQDSKSSEKLAIFESRIQDVFQNPRGIVASSYQQYRNLFESKLDAGQFVESVSQILNVEEVAAQDDDAEIIAKIDQARIKQFTGASPVGPLSFDTVGNAIAATVKIGVKAVGAIFKGIGKGLSKLFRWGKKKFSRLVSNPIDMVEVDGNEPFFENYYWTFTRADRQLHSSALIDVSFDSQEEANSWAARILNKYRGKWVKFHLVHGIYMIRLLDYYIHHDLGTAYNHYASYEAIFCPAANEMPEDPYLIKTLTEQSTGGISEKYQSWMATDIQLNDADSEIKKLRGLLWNIQTGCALIDAQDTLCGVPETTAVNIIVDNDYSWIPSSGTVTNADFFFAATGIYEASSASLIASTDKDSLISLVEISVEKLIGLWLSQQVKAYLQPANYPFLPYVNGKEALPNGRWSIKTDAANKSAFDRFFTSAIVVLATVAVGVAVGLKVRSAKRAKTMKRLQQKSVLDNKMWQGEQLTKREMKQYIKASRKLEASNVLTGPISASTPSLPDLGSSDTVDLLPYIIGPDR